MFGVKDTGIIDFSFSKHWNSGLRLFFSKHWNYQFQLFQTLELSISAFSKMENLKIGKTKLLTFNAWKSKTFEFHCLEV